MAIHAPITGAPSGATPLPAPWVSIGDVLARLGRADLEATIDALIDRLDTIDGDADAEDFDCDLEPDGTGGGDPAWIEWLTRGRHKTAADGGEPLLRLPWGGVADEDVEDCDPAEDDDASENDDPAGDPLDYGEMDEAENYLMPAYGMDQTARPIPDAIAFMLPANDL